MYDVFEDFFASMPDGVEVTTCRRCAELCRVSEPKNQDALLLRRTNDKENGLCANCAVTSWFKSSPFNKFLEDDPEKLLRKPIQTQFSEIMRAGRADMNPNEINWVMVVRYWDLPFP